MMGMTMMNETEDIRDVLEMDVDTQLPHPQGYRVLIVLPQADETYGETGLLKSNRAIYEEQVLSTIGLVMDMGDTAYKDETRFPTGPWCAIGDYVMFRANSGTRFRFGGLEYRLMNDDSIEATVPDPKAISRV
jgi:co-chaperonin GroES (HSP10)